VSQDNLSGSPEATPESVSRREEPEAGPAGEVAAVPREESTAETGAAAGPGTEAAVAEAPSEGGLAELPGHAYAAAEAEHAELTPQEDAGERPRSTLAEWTITILLLLFLTTTLVQAYVIPTGSMEDTLLIGDHLLVDKLAYAPPGPVSRYLLPYTEVKRGDIIVFRYPVDISQTFVKRAVGVPGDRIRIINKQLYLNGVKVDEPYTYHKTDYIDSYRDNFPGDPNVHVEPGAYEMLTQHVVNGEVVVPPGHYFALGDNRDSSLDSRFWGFVPRENIIGKPLIVYWSYDAPTEALNDSSISLRHLLDLSRNFFTKTRWKRTFLLIHGYPLQ
jgi:signal peptidase I